MHKTLIPIEDGRSPRPFLDLEDGEGQVVRSIHGDFLLIEAPDARGHFANARAAGFAPILRKGVSTYAFVSDGHERVAKFDGVNVQIELYDLAATTSFIKDILPIVRVHIPPMGSEPLVGGPDDASWWGWGVPAISNSLRKNAINDEICAEAYRAWMHDEEERRTVGSLAVWLGEYEADMSESDRKAVAARMIETAKAAGYVAWTGSEWEIRTPHAAEIDVVERADGTLYASVTTEAGAHFQCDYYGEVGALPDRESDFACDPPAWVKAAMRSNTLALAPRESFGPEVAA